MPGQAFIYRLNGDLNPLHVLKEKAAMAKFEKPILHGMCSLGICTRAIYKTYCKGNVSAIKEIKARFVSFVYPGETFIISMWRDGKQVIYEAMVKERNIKVIIGSVSIDDEKTRL